VSDHVTTLWGLGYIRLDIAPKTFVDAVQVITAPCLFSEKLVDCVTTRNNSLYSVVK